MITILSYPRSGQNLMCHMLNAVGLECEKTHHIRLWEQWPPKKEDILIVLVRDFRECIPRHIHPNEPVSIKMITAMFNREYGLNEPAAQYLQNLVLYDIYPQQKHLIYYEELVGKFDFDFNLFALDLGVEWPILIDFDWDTEFKKSLDKYPDPRSGKDVDYHKKRIEDIPLLEKLMRELNPIIFKKYLKRYETKWQPV